MQLTMARTVSAAAVLCLVGCSLGSASSDGTLRMGGDPGEVCLTHEPSGEYTYGLETLRNEAAESVALTGVTLENARGVAIAEAFVAPIEDQTLVGVLKGWPPTNVHPRAWADRRAVAGTSLTAADGDWNLVLHLVATTPDAEFTAARVSYVQGRRSYFAAGTTGVVMRASC